MCINNFVEITMIFPDTSTTVKYVTGAGDGFISSWRYLHISEWTQLGYKLGFDWFLNLRHYPLFHCLTFITKKKYHFVWAITLVIRDYLEYWDILYLVNAFDIAKTNLHIFIISFLQIKYFSESILKLTNLWVQGSHFFTT